MKVVNMTQLGAKMRSQILTAMDEPLLVVDNERPLVIIRNLLDDEEVDELIAQHPDFRRSIEIARQQKSAGQVRSLADLKEKYGLDKQGGQESTASELPEDVV